MRFNGVWLLFATFLIYGTANAQGLPLPSRERILLDTGWKFFKYGSQQKTDDLIYDSRPQVNEDLDRIAADARPTQAVKVKGTAHVLKPFILPTGNAFIKDSSKHFKRPNGNPGEDFPFVKATFDDGDWDAIMLPHDWAIEGPFYTEAQPVIGGGMGRLPVQGVAWYRRKIYISKADAGKSVFLDVDGAMSYAMVWLNGKLVGGWPQGYNSWRLDLTPFLLPEADNQLAIRIDNPQSSSRWYPGAGLYRNVWLTKTNAVHVTQWGTFVRTSKISPRSAQLDLDVTVDNKSSRMQNIELSTDVYRLDHNGKLIGAPVARIPVRRFSIMAGGQKKISGNTLIKDPALWFPAGAGNPNLYTAITLVKNANKLLDSYQTDFGIREILFSPENGLLVNGKKVYIKGVNQHSDLGALGMAFNRRAAERQLEMLREMGCNAIRMAHNPPSPELLELTDRMGFLVIDEIFDSWERKKTPLDFHLIFPEWSEQDLRALIRRDKNHPSVILWSYGNEVGEQYTDQAGSQVAKRLYEIAKDEDPTRLTTLAMNYAKPEMPLPGYADVIGLNYQGEGIRDGEAYSGLKGITTPPMFPSFHKKFPDKAILSTENAAAVSSRGTYLFPVYKGNSSPIRDSVGGDAKMHHVSAYEVYSVDFGSSADKMFATMAKHPYVAGGFAWSGWDYIGEPTPYYSSRSSYFGIIDLAGFKKDRFYLYQSQWRPELPMAHILPHWNWPDRMGKTTPVHLFTSGDEAELFLNGKSLGRKKIEPFTYRLRWDDVKYEPGELKAEVYRKGKKWAEDVIRTTGKSERLAVTADRQSLQADGKDLSFITVRIVDRDDLTVPRANDLIEFDLEGPGEIIATDNGDPTDMDSFSAHSRKAFNGLCLVVVRTKANMPGEIRLTAKSAGLSKTAIAIRSIK